MSPDRDDRQQPERNGTNVLSGACSERRKTQSRDRHESDQGYLENTKEAAMSHVGEIKQERGGYTYTIFGAWPCRCWSRYKPDPNQLKKTIDRQNGEGKKWGQAK